jgi:hypothetical protein
MLRMVILAMKVARKRLCEWNPTLLHSKLDHLDYELELGDSNHK